MLSACKGYDLIKDRFSTTIKSNCPQINVSMENNSFSGLNIKGKTYDGWTIKGQATCRTGKKEGENINYYYCGGYTISSLHFIMNEVNAYIEKTIISDKGDIGKTYKYVIWNIYNEKKEFIETRCIGNPDEYEKKLEKEFDREISKYS